MPLWQRLLKAQDIADTLDLALAASACGQARVVHKPRKPEQAKSTSTLIGTSRKRTFEMEVG